MLETSIKKYQFLEGGGEMGKLTRSYDWSQTPIGSIEHWPQSLRTMVDMILHSQVPMLLFWGEQMIQFYNDAYRPSLGEIGKHPMALGQRGSECWPEIWSIITPFIDRVREGGAMWSADHLIPIFRNGRIEDVYWTFGYSPVRDESGSVAGVLVICNETTQQVNALRRIEESERTLRAIVTHAPVGICILDAQSLKAEIVNDIFLELAGRSREELLTRPLWECFPEMKETLAFFLHSVSATATPHKGREQKLTLVRNGIQETMYADFVIEPFSGGKEMQLPKLMIIVIDVTDKVLARKTVEESEQRYKTLITESTVAIALYTGPELRIQYVNGIMTGYWGKDMSVVGKTLEEAVPELFGQPFHAQLKQVYEKGESYLGKEEAAVLEVDGKLQTFYFNYVYKPLKDTEGNVYGIHHMATDVTEQVLARKKVEQSEETLRTIILKAPVAMCILRGPQFVVEIANDLMFRLWGKNRNELIGKPIFEGLPEVKHQGFEEILGNVYTTGEPFSAYAVPISLPRERSPEIVFVNFVYEAYREADGTISGVMAVATDVTEQVKARQRVEELVNERTRELGESNKNLKRSNNELAQFAYIASHDLQEPARKITTFTEMLQKSLSEIDPRSKSLLDKIENSSVRMLSLIRDILAYSQLSKGKEMTSSVDLNQVLDTVLEDFELLIAEKQATIEATRLPTIEGIPVQINQLFSNMISNALKFTFEGRKAHINISCAIVDRSENKLYPELKSDHPYWKISFKDNGIGFNPRNARQIFDIFQRLHGKTEYAGTGIGLAMCKKIAQNHGGDIVAESEEGVGSTFHVLLPGGLD